MLITIGYASDRDEVIPVVDHEGLDRFVTRLRELQATAAPDHLHFATWTDDLTTGALSDAPVVHQLRMRLVGQEGGRDSNPHPGEWMPPLQRPEHTE